MQLIYTKSGSAFKYSVSAINKLSSKLKLQDILLEEFKKFAYEGKTKEDCITSCYWILSGLTLVSQGAAEGYPHLVQSVSF